MQQYIVGNWKMNGTKAEAQKLTTSLLTHFREATRPLPHIVLCPSYPYLTTVIEILKDSPIQVGAQDCHPLKCGAYTGDVSASQLADIGCKYVIIGHSERRLYHNESSTLIQQKLTGAIQYGLRPILCIGETKQEREAGKALHSLANQLTSDLPDDLAPHSLLIAYEPLWSIGTGITPSLEEVEEVMGHIKHEIADRMSGGALIPTLYGGSVNKSNAAQLLNLPHVNGLLVGGASLKLDEFWAIINRSVL